MKTRRNRRTLERAIAEARTSDEQALAHYQLAVFHDNNSREADAIPHYERALALGLDRHTQTQALAWLASSLYKTQQPAAALGRIDEALSLGPDPELTRFLLGLRRRVQAKVVDARRGADAVSEGESSAHG
jgi:tetratricopeptide (TPR) repeat protein